MFSQEHMSVFLLHCQTLKHPANVFTLIFSWEIMHFIKKYKQHTLDIQSV